MQKKDQLDQLHGFGSCAAMGASKYWRPRNQWSLATNEMAGALGLPGYMSFGKEASLKFAGETRLVYTTRQIDVSSHLDIKERVQAGVVDVQIQCLV